MTTPRDEPGLLEQADLWGDLDARPVAWFEAAEVEAARAHLRRRSAVHGPLGVLLRVVTALGALWLFVVSLRTMTAGAAALAPHLATSPLTAGVPSALGLGWLGALVVMSGSPVAASSLTLLAGDTLSRDESLAMLSGSRIGAAFVVLVVGFFYALRRTSGRRAPLSIGVMALLMTTIAYVPALGLGLGLLRGGVLDSAQVRASPAVLDLLGAVTGPLLEPLRPLGAWLFPLGVVGLLASFKLVDRLLPTFSDGALDERARFYLGRWSLVGLGCAVALVTMSVSVALTVLVPLVARGVVRREQALPYVAGANVTTLGDTLLAAFLLGSANAVRVVIAQVVAVTLVTVVLLVVAWRPLRRLSLAVTDRVLATPARLAAFTGALLAVPALLLLLRW